jgi:pheromone shutdown protein TraB
MHTPAADARNGGLGGAAKVVAEHASAIGRLEVELATIEVKKKVVAIGLGIGLGIGAAVFGLLMIGFAFATLAAVFATFLATWLALLIVTGILFALAALLGVLAIGRLSKGTPPLPEQAIREAKLTSEALKR